MVKVGRINLHNQMYNVFYCLMTLIYGQNRKSRFQDREWIFPMNQVLQFLSRPTNGTFQLVLTGFWACLLNRVLFRILSWLRQSRNQTITNYKQHCFQHYLEGTVVFLTVIHENAGLFAVVRLELEVQQSFSFPLLLQTLIFAISKCV